MWETTFYGPTIRQQYKMAAISGLLAYNGDIRGIVEQAELVADAAMEGDRYENSENKERNNG